MDLFSLPHLSGTVFFFGVTGVITTAVNWVIYSVLVSVYGIGINVSNIIAWLFAVIIAFFLNKTFVFQRHDWRIAVVFQEGIFFLGSRILSGIVEIGLVPVLMAIGVTQSIFGIKGFAAKFLASGIATVLSYLISKYAVFKDKTGSGDSFSSVSVEYHADDYGLFPAQSQRILDCYESGVLNAVSIMPNSPHLSQCMEQLPSRDQIAVAVHLNLMEGHSICSADRVGLLVDRNGNFSVTFGKLLVASYLPGRKKYRDQLREELRAQIYTVAKHLEDGSPLRIDGHAHYHMLPVVFDALMDIIQEEQLSVRYIRFPRERLSLYFRNWSSLTGFRPINFVKVLVLNFLVWRNCWKYRAFTEQLEQRIFLGVFFSGNMCVQNVRAVLPSAKALALQQHHGLEILAHPGGVYEKENIAQLTQKDDVIFLTSENRRQEAEMFQIIRENEGTSDERT